jgi:hypothetical protein
MLQFQFSQVQQKRESIQFTVDSSNPAKLAEIKATLRKVLEGAYDAAVSNASMAQLKNR